MKNNVLYRVISLLFALTFMMVCCTPFTIAASAEISLPAPSEHSEEYYIQQSNSIKVYNELLDSFSSSKTGRLKSDSNAVVYPDYYGGAYINPKTGGLVILVTDELSDQNTYELGVVEDNHNVTYAHTDVSYNEMCAVISMLSHQINALALDGVEITCIADNIMESTVEVSVVDLDAEKEKIIKNMANCEFLSFKNSERFENQTTNLGGGYKIFSSTGSGSTMGFAATMDGKLGYVISGHAGHTLGLTFSYNGTTIGSVAKTAYRNWSTADAAFVESNGNTTPTNIMANGGCIWAASMSALPVGASVRLYGATSNLQSGTITSTGATFAPTNGKTILNQYKADYASQGGDSGGPVLLYEGNYGGQSKYTLYGIHVGRFDVNAAFSSYRDIVNELGVTCITS